MQKTYVMTAIVPADIHTRYLLSTSQKHCTINQPVIFLVYVIMTFQAWDFVIWINPYPANMGNRVSY